MSVDMDNDSTSGEDPARTVPAVTLPAEAARAIAAAAQRARANTEERDRLIREAHHAGASLREIAAASGLHFTSVRKIIKKEK